MSFKRLSLLSLVVCVVVAALWTVSYADIGLNQWQFNVVDETGNVVTDSCTMTVTTTADAAATVYSTSNGTAIGSTITARTDGVFKFYAYSSAFNISVKNNVTGQVVTRLSQNISNHTLTIPKQMTTVDRKGYQLYGAVKTKRVTIGGVGVTGQDFAFTTAANTTEQVINCGAIVPARARVLDVTIINTDAALFSGGATTLAAELGSSSSGNEYASSATIYAAGAAVSGAAAGAPFGAISTSAGNVYVAATPGANWSTMTAGKWTVMVTYLDLDAIK